MAALDCGHRPSPHGQHTTGTAHTTDGREICCQCADDEQRRELKTEQTYMAYLSSDKTRLTTWTGGELATITYLHQGRHNIGGSLYRFRATDVHGQDWYGTTPGPGMYARMRRTKSRK